MEASIAKGILIAALLTGISPVNALAADEIKGGKWEFTTHMEMPAGQAAAGGGAPMTITGCVDAANPVPANTHCTLGKVQRNGGIVNWAMTCNSPQGPIQSAGSARYAGETMTATLTARVPGPNGSPVDTPGRITGRYLGPCEEK